MATTLRLFGLCLSLSLCSHFQLRTKINQEAPSAPTRAPVRFIDRAVIAGLLSELSEMEDRRSPLPKK